MNKTIKTITAGILGTIVMTLVTMLASMMGLPKMSPPKMLSEMLNLPEFLGWVMHFMIGVGFAFVYTYLCKLKNLVSNYYLKGALFGIMVFIIAQVMMKLMGTMIPIPKIEGSTLGMMMGSLIGHIIFGAVVGGFMKKEGCADHSCEV